jgi:hypothetical protein
MLRAWHRPADLSELVEAECCHQNCHTEMARRGGMACPSSTQARVPEDFHTPWGPFGWDEHSDDEVMQECCLHTCHLEMDQRALKCDAPLEQRGPDDNHQPSDGRQFAALTNEDMMEECCRPVEPWITCLRSNCTSFMQLVQGPPFSSTPPDPAWSIVTQDPQWGENSTWVLEQVVNIPEWSSGMVCACNHCYEGPNMLNSIWPASHGVCSELADL